MVELSSCIYEGSVMHHRLSPVQHRFVYKVFSSLIDLDELSELNKLKFFSVNRFNLFSFHEKDHGGKQQSLAKQTRSLLEARGYEDAGHTIKLLCYPRILGYAFNPLSIYFCYNSDNQLKVILYEVSNTFGSRHTYLLEVETPAQAIRHGCEKKMYVSPFMPMNTAYSFLIQPPEEQISVLIQQTEQVSVDEKRPILKARFSGKKRTISNRSLLMMFCKYPLMTVKVIAGIHWEALQLWRKKLKIQPREKHVTHTISWQDKHGAIHNESL